jgi:hypothetical protein
MSGYYLVVNLILLSILVGLFVLEAFDTIMDKIEERKYRKQSLED